jgi:hypothetical protein
VFHPPRVFGPEWTVSAGEEKEKFNEKRWRDLGVKIATGFEIMYKEGGKRRTGKVGDLHLVTKTAYGLSMTPHQVTCAQIHRMKSSWLRSKVLGISEPKLRGARNGRPEKRRLRKGG